jgi:NAD(P)-dependent dehydrogenase (short-subunit alcohol dehydrogenase family)
MSDGKRVALVTGAGSGIGRAVALALQKEGYSVVLSGRRKAGLEQTAALAAKDGGSLLPVPSDITKPEAVEGLFNTTRRELGRLDVLFNNAGTFVRSAPMEELTYAEWQAVVDVNLTGSFLCAQQAIKLMKSQTPKGGRIINNGSISAHAPRPFSAPYTATKHAITGLTKSIALDYRADDIACGQIDIGNAETEMTASIKVGALQADGKRLPEPTMHADAVARAVVYMAGLPLDANVLFMTVMATKMPFVGRG